MSRKLIASLPFFLFPNFAIAGQPNSVEVHGSGTISCVTWTYERLYDQVKVQFAEDWILGYLTEDENWVSITQNRSLSFSINNAAIFAWIDNYCKVNPLAALSDAARDLVANNKIFTYYAPSN